jgi:hypothetical protein
LVTALHHNFTELLSFDAHQTQAAIAQGLTPVKG